MTTSEDDVALRLLHTADWHLGRGFPGFDERDRQKLTRARLAVLDNILGCAEQHGVDAILCAGDLFDEPNPDREWWEPLAAKLSGMRTPRKVVLLPGNHDPLRPGSVYERDHAFRGRLPPWVHVVDRDDFTLELNDAAVLHARPCRSQAGHEDLALALPARAPGDERIRIGLVHGNTFDMPGHQTSFPLARDAAARRGFDYLAIGDTHSHRVVSPPGQPPVVYPGAPEATTFDEPDSGRVLTVFVSARRTVRMHEHRVAAWHWRTHTVRTLAELREVHADGALAATVLRLVAELHLPAPELEEAERLLTELKGTDAVHGRAGILQLERRVTLDTVGIEAALSDLPEVLEAAVGRLREHEAGDKAEIARAALFHLYMLVREARS